MKILYSPNSALKVRQQSALGFLVVRPGRTTLLPKPDSLRGQGQAAFVFSFFLTEGSLFMFNHAFGMVFV